VIVTVTLNPALQVEYGADQFVPGAANEISRVSYRAGGRGLAVAKVLQMFGHEVVAAGLAGGQAGDLVRAELARSGVATQFTPIAAETRRAVLVRDAASGAVTSLQEPAPFITTEELGRLAADYRSLLDGADAVVLCGSLPAGLPVETYGSLVSYAAEAGVPVVLNAWGNALRYGAVRRPALVIPDLAADADRRGPGPSGSGVSPGYAVPPQGNAGARDVAGLSRDANALLAAGVGAVAIPGAAQMLVLTPAGRWLARLAAKQPMGGLSAVRGGRLDALVAGLVPGIALAWSWPDALAHAMAMTAAWCDPGELDIEAYEQLLPEVEVEKLT
jgi:tagatose 6-phosphate kinase